MGVAWQEEWRGVVGGGMAGGGAWGCECGMAGGGAWGGGVAAAACVGDITLDIMLDIRYIYILGEGGTDRLRRRRMRHCSKASTACPRIATRFVLCAGPGARITAVTALGGVCLDRRCAVAHI